MTEIDFHRREFTDGEELALGLADWTSARLRAAIAARGVALLVVSGGKSPAPRTTFAVVAVSMAHRG
jgi:6-phosphogluconolactonase/glucosamine-6-phosphate isomerase/deaminase